MYTGMHWMSWRNKIQDWTARAILGIDPKDINNVVLPPWVEKRRVESGKEKGKEYIIIQKEMRSLDAYSLPKYQRYENWEKNLYKPSKEWIIHAYGPNEMSKRQKIKL